MPWEVIIKDYRARRKDTKHDSLELFALDFLAYVRDERTLFPEAAQRHHLEMTVGGYFMNIQDRVLETIRNTMAPGQNRTDKELQDLADTILEGEHQLWESARHTDGAEAKHGVAVRAKYMDLIERVIAEVFEKFPLSKQGVDQLKDIGVWLSYRRPEGMAAPGDSGVVIAGYGQKDIYPRLRSYMLFGLVEGVLNFALDRKVDIGTDVNATIVPFAQSEMVTTFMEGMDPMLSQTLENDLGKIFEQLPDAIVSSASTIGTDAAKELSDTLKKATKGFMERYRQGLRKFQREKFIMPVVHMVGVLPKDELASMAEALVNLTSFKRHVSRQAETVGGPIDVAVISKGDGFIWIKRKHYFDPKLNHHFLSNYFSAQD